MDSLQLARKLILCCGRTLRKPSLLRPNTVLEQMTQIGVLALPTVGLACLFMGIVMAMNGAYQLQKFGQTDLVADLVGVSIFREIGPLITAIIVIGRSGSSITAEIGTMQVSEEIDALQVMAVDPVRYLILPRILAMTIMLPCLTILGECLGLVGGGLIATGTLGINPYFYGSRLLQAVAFKDLASGLFKSLIFGVVIGFIACENGLKVSGGAEGVGKATTESVVQSLSWMLGVDCLLTALFYFM